MGKPKVTAIFDVGKTNKKLCLFDEQYKIVFEESTYLEETKDEDGFPCEDLSALTQWLGEKFRQITSHPDYHVQGVNFSAYGASFIHLDASYKPLTPLYNYLKPYPEKLKEQFYDTYGGEGVIARQTASPVLGSLNSGMQLYRLKYEQPKVFASLKYALHLPQYLSFVVSSHKTSDITSIGCHTHLWDFQKEEYHRWVVAEGIQEKLPQIYLGDQIVHRLAAMKNMTIGIGLHDSSAALIPYLKLFQEPFILLSTGTWSISLNPFNFSMLTDDELERDCLCYLTYQGKPVKASRLFAGHEHEEQVKRLAKHFHKDENYYKTVAFDSTLLAKSKTHPMTQMDGTSAMMPHSVFGKRLLEDFKNYEEAYHQLIQDIMTGQVKSTNLVLAQTPVKKIFVDGGFAKNEVFMHLLAASFPNIQVYSANIAQASALGAALVLCKEEAPSNLIDLKLYKTQINGKASFEKVLLGRIHS